MSSSIRPGELVVHRVRWHEESGFVGLAVSTDEVSSSALVLWGMDDVYRSLRWHLVDSLTVITDSNVTDLRKRCSLSST